MNDGVLQLDLPSSDVDVASRGTSSKFVIGPENCLLAPPIERLLGDGDGTEIDDAAPWFNPLVIVGPPGSGKSHLVQGLIRRVRETTPAEQIGYFTAADYGREFQTAQTDEHLDDWRGRVRSLRLLVIEDLEQLRPRTTIHYDLRQTIDAVVAAGGAVIVTAEREPALILSLDAGLRDRLAAGLLVRLHRPGPAARRAIIRQTAAARGLTISDQEVAKLARREATTPAQLIGRIAAHSSLSGSLPLEGRAGEGGELGTRILTPAPKGGGEPECARQIAQMKQIIAVTARYFCIPQAALTGPSRRWSLVAARNIAVHLARQLTDLSYATIGHWLGGRDHTTIMHAERRLAEQLAADPAIERAVEELDRLLR